ncbi:hypothetical protein BGZ76_006519 [Entomortierella beljakovae]|nr:hypothetical protein BGZ76_006519 [Entomortierella beljakovae]
MSYTQDSKREWHNTEFDDSGSPFQDNPTSTIAPSPSHQHRDGNDYNNSNSNVNGHRSPSLQQQQQQHQHQQDYYHDDEEQYPVGRPLSYFPTHHQPLSQQEYDEEQQRTNQYHGMAPMEHAQSPLSNRSPAWGGGGYSGYQNNNNNGASDIPLVGIDIISSNMDAVRNGNKYSDTRTPEEEASFNQNRGGYDSGAGTVENTNYNNNDQQQQYNNQADNQNNRASYNSNTYNNDRSQPQQQTPTAQGGSYHEGYGAEGEDIPKALLDPKVQRQLNKRKVWKPYFIWVVSAIQIAMLVFEIVKGYQRTGKVIETNPFNPMIGPSTGTIIVTGARFVPCMRSTYLDHEQIQCPDNSTVGSPAVACSISDICGFTPIDSTGKPPNQWFRFITPIFLHGGVVHLLFNLVFQLRTGADLERDMGWWRIGIIYMASGIGGFILGGNFAPLLSPSMGASGAIFGLIGCLVLDLIQNWKLVVRPCWEMSKLSLMILFSFAFGLLPFLDNFAHIGGFFTGILTGLVFMPVVYFSKRDKLIKLGLRVIALPLIILIIVLGLTNFYKGENNCSWCKYLSCLPINGWCDAFDTQGGPSGTGTGTGN